jgi:hypothetical protein
MVRKGQEGYQGSGVFTVTELEQTARFWSCRDDCGSRPDGKGRFKSFPIQEDDHLWTVLRYVERNPLRAKLVEEAEAWRWSSLWHWVHGDKVGLLDDGPLTLPRRWLQRVQAPQTEAELAALRCSVVRGCPFREASNSDTQTARLLPQRGQKPGQTPQVVCFG